MSGRILCVDDTPANLRLLTAVLTPQGYDVVTAENGTEALQKVDGDTDLVLLDVTMPGMNGYEVCRRIREDPATSRVPIVMITATGEEQKVLALDAGAEDFIRRPFELPELLARVRSLLRIKASTDTIEGQAAELRAWSQTLEERVEEQVAELGRLRTLERFLPAPLAEALLAESGERVLEPHRAEVAIVSLALHGFGEAAMRGEPEDVVGLLAAFHRHLGPQVEANRATASGSTGDRVSLIVGDPLASDDPADGAVRLALAMAEAMAPELEPWRQRGHRIELAAGISVGHATLGLLGHQGRHDYFAIGPVTVIAHHLCEYGGGGIRCDGRTRAILGDRISGRTTGSLDLPGMPPTEVFEIRSRRADDPVAGSRLRIGILGPIEVHVDGRETAVSSARERALLAALAACAGQVVSVDALADGLWEGSPPDSAAAAIRVYVSRLRKTLQVAGIDDILETRPPGYRLLAGDGVLDTDRFRAAVDEAVAARPTDPARAIERYRHALSLWRGRALPEVADSPFARPIAAQLDESRLAVTEACITLELEVGHLQTAVTELEGLVSEQPLRERFRALAMIGLAGLGRPADAIRVHDDYAKALFEEIGTAPSAALGELRDLVLRSASTSELIAGYVGVSA